VIKQLTLLLKRNPGTAVYPHTNSHF